MSVQYLTFTFSRVISLGAKGEFWQNYRHQHRQLHHQHRQNHHEHHRQHRQFPSPVLGPSPPVLGPSPPAISSTLPEPPASSTGAPTPPARPTPPANHRHCTTVSTISNVYTATIARMIINSTASIISWTVNAPSTASAITSTIPMDRQ